MSWRYTGRPVSFNKPDRSGPAAVAARRSVLSGRTGVVAQVAGRRIGIIMCWEGPHTFLNRAAYLPFHELSPAERRAARAP